jgi:hypothetical protein
MTKSTTPSFITTIPLVVTSRDEAELLSRFQAGRQLYNALLNEAIVRMRLVQKSRHWYVQLINKGKSYQKPANYVAEGVVGLDLNISNVCGLCSK